MGGVGVAITYHRIRAPTRQGDFVDGDGDGEHDEKARHEPGLVVGAVPLAAGVGKAMNGPMDAQEPRCGAESRCGRGSGQTRRILGRAGDRGEGRRRKLRSLAHADTASMCKCDRGDRAAWNSGKSPQRRVRPHLRNSHIVKGSVNTTACDEAEEEFEGANEAHSPVPCRSAGGIDGGPPSGTLRGRPSSSSRRVARASLAATHQRDGGPHPPDDSPDRDGIAAAVQLSREERVHRDPPPPPARALNKASRALPSAGPPSQAKANRERRILVAFSVVTSPSRPCIPLEPQWSRSHDNDSTKLPTQRRGERVLGTSGQARGPAPARQDVQSSKQHKGSHSY